MCAACLLCPRRAAWTASLHRSHRSSSTAPRWVIHRREGGHWERARVGMVRVGVVHAGVGGTRVGVGVARVGVGVARVGAGVARACGWARFEPGWALVHAGAGEFTV